MANELQIINKTNAAIGKTTKAFEVLDSQMTISLGIQKTFWEQQKNINKALNDSQGIKAFSDALRELNANIKAQSDAQKQSIDIQKKSELLTREQLKTNILAAKGQEQVTRETLKTEQAQRRASAQTTKLTQAQKQLAAATTAQRGSIAQLNAVTAILTARRTALGNITTSNKSKYDALTSAISRNVAKQKELGSAVGRNQLEVGNYGIGLGKGQSAMASYTKGLGGMATGFRNIVGAFGFIGGIQLFAKAIKDAFQQIRKFGKDSAILAGVLGKTRSEITKLTDDAKRLGAITAKTSSEILGLQTAYARLGFSQEDIIDLTEDTINGSIALNAELADTAELTGVVVKSFDDLKTTDADLILDQMTLATQKTALSFDKLQTAIPIAAGAAAAAKVPFTTMIAQLGQAADRGIDASTAATSLRNIYITLADKGITLEAALSKINTSQNKLSVANEIFGKRAAVTALALASTTTKTTELDRALRDAGGTAKRVADEQLKTLDGRITIMTSAWQGFIDSLNSGNGSITKTFSALTDGITENISKLTRMNTTFEELVNRDVDKNMREVVSALKDMGDEIKDGEDVRKILFEQMEAYGAAAERTSSELRDLGGETGVLDELGTAFNINVGSKNKRDFLAQLTEEYKNTKKALRDLLSVQNTEEFDKFADSILNQTSALDNLKGAEGEIEKVETDLIKIQEELLKSVKEMPGATESQITARNKWITTIEKEITRLKELGELKKVPDQIEKPKLDIEKESPLLDIEALDQAEIDAYLDKELKKTEILKEQEEARQELRTQMHQEIFNTAVSLGNSLFEASQEKLTQETEAIQAEYDTRLSNEVLDDEQRALIEAERDAKLNEQKKKERELQKKQFLFNKAVSLAQIGINTAQAITAQLAITPLPIGAPLVASIIAIGALQAAAVVASAVPAFDKGTKSAPGGGFLVGEERPEFMEHNGRVALIDKPTFFGNEFKGSEIWGGAESARIMDKITHSEVINSVANVGSDIQGQMIAAAVEKSFSNHSNKMIAEMKRNRPRKQTGLDGLKRTDNLIKGFAE